MDMNLDELQPVQETALWKQIYITVGKAIAKHQPGDMLPTERDLAKQLKVSLPTVRQALDQLERDGLISKARGQRTKVV